jgi:tRNA (adenine22-N1)-methyltransferase
MALLTRQAAPNIHFVDIVAELIDTLDSKLQQFFSNSPSAWTTHCLDVHKLPLRHYQKDLQAKHQNKHLVIIAGVGGDLMSRFIEEIYQHNLKTDIDFLLCPVHHQFTLRQKLIELNFSLKEEVLIEENRRFYEMLLVSANEKEGTKVSPIGDKIWLSNSSEQAIIIKNYLRQTLSHYQRIQLNHSANIQGIIDAYQTKMN